MRVRLCKCGFALLCVCVLSITASIWYWFHWKSGVITHSEIRSVFPDPCMRATENSCKTKSAPAFSQHSALPARVPPVPVPQTIPAFRNRAGASKLPDLPCEWSSIHFLEFQSSSSKSVGTAGRFSLLSPFLETLIKVANKGSSARATRQTSAVKHFLMLRFKCLSSNLFPLVTQAEVAWRVITDYKNNNNILIKNSFLKAGNVTDCRKTWVLSSAMRFIFLAEPSAALPSVWRVLDAAPVLWGGGGSTRGRAGNGARMEREAGRGGVGGAEGTGIK